MHYRVRRCKKWKSDSRKRYMPMKLLVAYCRKKTLLLFLKVLYFFLSSTGEKRRWFMSLFIRFVSGEPSYVSHPLLKKSVPPFAQLLFTPTPFKCFFRALNTRILLFQQFLNECRESFPLDSVKVDTGLKLIKIYSNCKKIGVGVDEESSSVQWWAASDNPFVILRKSTTWSSKIHRKRESRGVTWISFNTYYSLSEIFLSPNQEACVGRKLRTRHRSIVLIWA